MGWSRYRTWLLPALQDDCPGGEAELLSHIASGRAQLWAGRGAALVTERVCDAGVHSLHVWLAGGELSEILALRPGIEAWARAQGCQFITIDGRPGWARVLRTHGYVGDGDLLRGTL